MNEKYQAALEKRKSFIGKPGYNKHGYYMEYKEFNSVWKGRFSAIEMMDFIDFNRINLGRAGRKKYKVANNRKMAVKIFNHFLLYVINDVIEHNIIFKIPMHNAYIHMADGGVHRTIAKNRISNKDMFKVDFKQYVVNLTYNTKATNRDSSRIILVPKDMYHRIEEVAEANGGYNTLASASVMHTKHKTLTYIDEFHEKFYSDIDKTTLKVIIDTTFNLIFTQVRFGAEYASKGAAGRLAIVTDTRADLARKTMREETIRMGGYIKILKLLRKHEQGASKQFV